MAVKAYKSRVIVSGGVLELYEYERPVFYGFDDDRHTGRSSQNVSEEVKAENRDKVLSRARKALRRLINTNIGDNSKFVTLTFKDNVQDFETANYEFTKFIQRLSYYLKRKVTYAVVPEFQKRGAIHYHVVLFNVGYVPSKDLSKIWGQGFVKINKIDNVDNVGAYVCKYMSKDNDDERLKEKKCYFTSRGLDKPLEIIEKEQVENLARSLPANCLVYDNTFSSDELGCISYKQYNLNKK